MNSLEVANRRAVSAFAVFSDATLVDMCRRLPQDLDHLTDVSGVGSVKRDLYGESFTDAIQQYLAEKATGIISDAEPDDEMPSISLSANTARRR